MNGREAYGCGQCLPCRINKKRVWTHRIMLESSLHTDNAFVTLTYSDENLPKDGSLVPRHVQLFLKKVRKEIEPARLRFFCVGEYGDRTQRPHYHVALFGYPPCSRGRTDHRKEHCCENCDRIRRSWNLGTAKVIAGLNSGCKTRILSYRLNGQSYSNCPPNEAYNLP